MSLLNPWIAYSDVEPDDGQNVLCYVWIEDWFDGYDPDDKAFLKHDGKLLLGPLCRVVKKEFMESSDLAKIVFWQPIEDLP